MDVKKISKLKFIITHIITFIIFDWLVKFFIYDIGSVYIYFFAKTNTIVYLILHNIFWIIISAATIYMTFIINKYKTIDVNEKKSTRNILLIIFLILIIGINISKIISYLSYNLIIETLMILLHMFIIMLLNNYMFEKSLLFIKEDLRTFLIIITLFCTIISLYIIYDNQMRTMTCYRNDDIIKIKFNRNGIENIKKNGRNIEKEDLTLYRLRFVSKFALNSMDDKKSDMEIIYDHMEDVAKYEYKTYNYNSTCYDNEDKIIY